MPDPVTPEMIEAAERALDPGDLAEAVNHGYNPCELAEAAIRAALDVMGLKEERRGHKYKMVAVSWDHRYVTEWQPVEVAEDD